MHRIRDGRLRRLGSLAGLMVIAALAVVSTTSASVDVGNSGGSSRGLTNDERKVTICHAVKGEGETKNGYNIISVDKDSINPGHAQHNEEGKTDIIPAFPAANTTGRHGPLSAVRVTPV